MNLVIDGLLVLVLVMELGELNIMKCCFFSFQESIFFWGLGVYIICIGLVFVVVIIIFMVWVYYSVDLVGVFDSWKIMVFIIFCIVQMGYVIVVCFNYCLIIEMNFLINFYLWGVVIVIIILQLCLVYFEFLRNFFGIDWFSFQ